MAKSKMWRRVEKADRIPIHWQGVTSDIKKGVGIQMTLKDPDAKELEAEMAKSKKAAEFYFTVDGNKFIVDVRVGTKRTILGQFDLASEKDAAKRRATLQYLVANDLATQSDLDKFNNANPDPKVMESLKSDIYRADMDLKSDKANREILKKWNNYSKEARAEGYNAQALLKEWLKQNRQSWVHYLDFVDAIDAGGDPKTIFDTHMKEGAQFPVNLPPKFQSPVEHDIANGKVPNLKPARDAICQIVNAKFIPAFLKDRIPLYDKSIKELEAKLKELKKRYAAMGGR